MNGSLKRSGPEFISATHTVPVAEHKREYKWAAAPLLPEGHELPKDLRQNAPGKNKATE